MADDELEINVLTEYEYRVAAALGVPRQFLGFQLRVISDEIEAWQDAGYRWFRTPSGERVTGDAAVKIGMWPTNAPWCKTEKEVWESTLYWQRQLFKIAERWVGLDYENKRCVRHQGLVRTISQLPLVTATYSGRIYFLEPTSPGEQVVLEVFLFVVYDLLSEEPTRLRSWDARDPNLPDELKRQRVQVVDWKAEDV